jgi:uncharacterized protein YqeY
MGRASQRKQAEVRMAGDPVERDQLKAALTRLIEKMNPADRKYARRIYREHLIDLAAHDAEVIEQMLSNMLYEKGMTASHYKCVELVRWIRSYVNQLRTEPAAAQRARGEVDK